MKPSAVIFDWDDTLVITWDIVRAAINTTLTAMGSTPWTEEEAKQRIGPPAKVLFSGLFGEDKWQEADRIYINAYSDSIAGNIRVHDHAKDILQLLNDQKIYTAVVSTKRGPLLRKESTELGFDPYFKKLVGTGDAPKDKPHIEAVLHALEGSDIKPDKDVWFIGDSTTDIICANNAGCLPLLVETKLPPADLLAQYPPAMRFKTHQDLLDFIIKSIS